MSSEVSAASQGGNEASIAAVATSLELFFDLVFVFAITQVTSFLSNHLTWVGIVTGRRATRSAVVGYSWLTNAMPAEVAIPARLVILSMVAAILVVSLAVPDTFGGNGVLFGVAYFVVLFLQVALYALATGRTPETQRAILRLAPGFLGGPALLIVARFFDGLTQGALWALALTVDYGAPLVRGVAGFHVRARHFVERHGEIIMIALGESIVAIGTAGLKLDVGTVLAVFFAVALSGALWWTYFDVVVLAAERRLVATQGDERVRLARDSYSYLHLIMVSRYHLGRPRP